MKQNNLRCLWQGFRKFYQFAPGKLIVIFALMLFQGVTAGVGLLFIIPLLQIVGFEIATSSNLNISNTANQLFAMIGVAPSLENVLLSYVIIVSLIASVRYQLAVMTTSLQQSYISYLRDTLYRALLRSRWEFIVQGRMSDFTHSLTGQVQELGQASHLMLSFFSDLLLTLVMLALALLLSVKMTLFACVFAILLLVLLLPFNRIVSRSGQHQLTNFKLIFQMLTEQLASLKMIKSYASEQYHANQVKRVSETLEAQHCRLVRMNAITQWISMVGTVIVFSLFFYVAQSVLAVPLATILLLLVIFSRLLPQISGLQKTYQQLLHKVPAYSDVEQMLQNCEAAREDLDPEAACPDLQHQIVLKNIVYRYPQKDDAVFDDLTLAIRKNQTLALVGASGAGKSTLADLIAGLLEPCSGEIYCDDTVLNEKNRAAWRQRVAYVTQEIYLFHDSIRVNLQWVSAKALSDEELWCALRKAAAEDFVAALPVGLETIIGDRGIRLSGGERQRLALARALLADPQLLILDEATSALDHENERKIQQALEQLQGQLTIVIIAHRETTITHADSRFVLASICKSDLSKEDQSKEEQHKKMLSVDA